MGNFAQNNKAGFGIPLITNYLPKDYKADVQCWSVVQDKRGLMYFSNFKGVLEYDGVNWRLIEIPNGIVRALAVDKDGVIYVGGFNEVGYLAPDESGKLKYNSLNKFITDSPNLGEVWTILPRSKGLYVQTISTLYLLKADKNSSEPYLKKITSHPSVEKWSSRTRINPILSVGERIFVQEKGLALQELVDGRLQMIPGGEQFAEDMVYLTLPYPDNAGKSNKILVGSRKKGLFIFDGLSFQKFNTEADQYLIQNKLYFRGAVLGDGSFALGTQLGGIVVIGSDGRLKKIINKESGLSNNAVWDLYYDREGNLWAGLDNGIAKILYPSPITMIDERFGYEGTIINMFSFKDKLYLATASGLYFSGADNKFHHIKEITFQSWKFLPIDGRLFLATNSGIYELSGETAKIAESNLRFINNLYRSKADKEIIFVGLYDGLAIVTFTNGSLKYIGHIPVIPSRISSFAEDDKGDLWIVEMSGEIKRIRVTGDRRILSSYSLDLPDNPPGFEREVKMFEYNGLIYFYGGNEIYRYDYNKNRFVKSDIVSRFINSSDYTLMSIVPDNHNIIWCLVKNNGKALILEIDEKSKKGTQHNFLELVKDKIPSEVFESIIYPQTGQNTILWIGATNTLIKYNPSSAPLYGKTTVIRPEIRGVEVNDSLVFGGYLTAGLKNIQFSHKAASIRFQYSLPSYVNEYGNDYQYFLEGFDKGWSSWTIAAKKEYTNLSSGDYVFKIRSRNAVGQISDITSFPFTVLPPWYRTWWANVIGFLILLTILNYVVRYRVEFLRKKNIILERTVSERTAKINEQKEILERQAEKLRELDHIKSSFFANISHEFRTPLTLIKGQLETVLGTMKDENTRKKLIMAFNNSNRLHRLINQILDLSKLESGKIKLDLEQLDLIKLISTRVASFESIAEKNGIELILTKKHDKVLLTADRGRLEEVIDNLLSNAVKFTAAKGIIELCIDIKRSGYSENAVITIRDTGMGIPADKLIHIFDRFYQADDSSTKQFEGSGLGLSIVKDLVELHGGSITVESKLNSGTTFTITLPYEEIETGDEIKAENEHSGTAEEDKPLVLIVEDSHDMRSYIKENLQTQYRIEEAENGEEGINRAVEKIPDLIITDVMMPKIDGFELCANLKHDQKTSHIPIIILTAKADEENKLSGLLIGADDFLAKPFSPRELEIRVGNLIRIRQLLREKYKEISVIKPEEIKANPIDKNFLDKVFSIIKEHLEDHQFGVQVLATEVGMSVSQLNRKLNALISQSAGKLIRATRLDYSARLLEKNAGNITEIAYRIGFSDVSSFTNSFKEKYGITPSEYLKSKETPQNK